MSFRNRAGRSPRIVFTMKFVRLVAALTATLMAAPLRAEPPLALKDAFARSFRIGAALGTSQILGEDPKAMDLVARQFNAITPENLLKWAEVHPQPEQYNFDPADKYVAFGEQHDMFIVGHTLVWHNQTPPWVFEDESGQPLSREALLKRMREHIDEVVGRYKGRIDAWDVVNEALEDDGSLRETPWKQIIGEDYLEHAFQFAHEADPKAELYYNDYNEWHPGKRRAVRRLVKNLKAKDVRIDGIGLQGHWGMDYPSLGEIDAMFQDYGKLGVRLMITELDVNILPRPGTETGAEVSATAPRGDDLNPYANGLPDKVNQTLAKRYADVFRTFLKHEAKIDRVTFWGVHNGQSWLNDWPIRGRTAYPLLFDRQLQPNLAFETVMLTADADKSK